MTYYIHSKHRPYEKKERSRKIEQQNIKLYNTILNINQRNSARFNTHRSSASITHERNISPGGVLSSTMTEINKYEEKMKKDLRALNLQDSLTLGKKVGVRVSSKDIKAESM